MADGARAFWSAPGNPLSSTYMGRSLAASLNIFERMTRRYTKPEFGIKETVVDGRLVAVQEEIARRVGAPAEEALRTLEAEGIAAFGERRSPRSTFQRRCDSR